MAGRVRMLSPDPGFWLPVSRPMTIWSGASSSQGSREFLSSHRRTSRSSGRISSPKRTSRKRRRGGETIRNSQRSSRALYLGPRPSRYSKKSFKMADRFCIMVPFFPAGSRETERLNPQFDLQFPLAGSKRRSHLAFL